MSNRPQGLVTATHAWAKGLLPNAGTSWPLFFCFCFGLTILRLRTKWTKWEIEAGVGRYQDSAPFSSTYPVTGGCRGGGMLLCWILQQQAVKCRHKISIIDWKVPEYATYGEIESGYFPPNTKSWCRRNSGLATPSLLELPSSTKTADVWLHLNGTSACTIKTV